MNNIKKIIFIFVLFFIFLFSSIYLIILLKKPIKIGFCGVLTGIASELGISARNGVKIAVDNINKSGGIRGRKVELIIKDDENNEDTGLSVVKELHSEGVIAIIGHTTSAAIGKSIDYINKNRILMISPTVSASEYENRDDYFIRVVSSAKIQSEFLAKKAITDNNKKIVSIYDLSNKRYTEDTFINFKKKFESLGGKIISFKTFNSNEKIDFYDMVKELINLNPQAFLLITNGMNTANICQQIRKFNKDIIIYAGLWAMTEDLILYGGKNVENIYIFGEFDINDKEEKYVNFKKQYIERYKTVPSFSSIYGYEAAQVLFLALKKSKKWDSDSLKKTILKIKKFEGLQKDYIINEYGDTYRDYFLFTVHNAEFVKIE